MTIAIRIDRLVLDGLPPGAHDEGALTAAFEAELTRLVAAGGLDITRGFSVSRLECPSIEVGRATTSAAVGRDVARALYDGVASTSGADRRTGPPTGRK